jgi:hypothetical protein
MVGVVINPHAVFRGSHRQPTQYCGNNGGNAGSDRSARLITILLSPSGVQGTHCGAKTSVDALGDQEGAISATPLWPVSAQATTHPHALLWHCPTNQLPGAMQIGLPVHHYI